MNTISYKRPLLFLLIGSVIFGALLGIILVLRDNWGWIESRIMLTTIVIAVASICGLACDLSRMPRGLNLKPRVGLVSTLIAALMLMLQLWEVVEDQLSGKYTVCMIIFAVASVHVCLLSIAKLKGRYRWVSFIANQLIYGLAGILIALILFATDPGEMWKFIAALSIVIAAMTLVIPMLHRICKSDDKSLTLMPVEERNLAQIDAELADLRQRIATLETIRAEILE